jgi:hypothetical protein
MDLLLDVDRSPAKIELHASGFKTVEQTISPRVDQVVRVEMAPLATPRVRRIAKKTAPPRPKERPAAAQPTLW